MGAPRAGPCVGGSDTAVRELCAPHRMRTGWQHARRARALERGRAASLAPSSTSSRSIWCGPRPRSSA
eukprot:3248091-Prymnesium_polylepis.1